MLELDKISDTYEILEEIGAGGGGTVYKAYHKRLKKDVVIKKIHDDVQDIINIRAEADILKNLRHEFLPQVFDFLEIDGSIFTVIDFIPGQSLQELLDAGEKFSEKQIVKWAKQLAEALNYLHNQTPAIIHGDIKPANIMLTPNEDICLIDFNISSVFDNNDLQPIGFSDGYSPPEQYPEKVRKQKLANKPGSSPLEKAEHTLPNLLSNHKAAMYHSTEVVKRTEALDKTEVLSKREGTDRTEVYAREELSDKTEVFAWKELSDKTEVFAWKELSNQTEVYDQTEVYEKTEILGKRRAQNQTEVYEKTEILGKREAQNQAEVYEKTEILGKREAQNQTEVYEKTEILGKREVQNQTEVYHNKELSNKADITNKAEGKRVSPLKDSSTTTYGKIDERSDIYALGATLLHLITGIKPSCSLFNENHIDNQTIKISDGLCYTINKMMNPIPNKRFDSAEKLLVTLNQIKRLDKRYKRFMLKQEITVIVFLLLFAFCILSINHGKILLRQEKIDQYDNYIKEIISMRSMSNYDVDDIYQNAIRLFPDKIDAYYEYVRILYEQGRYEDTIDFIHNNIDADYNNYNTDVVDQKLGNIQNILGNCYFEIADYINACLSFREAINYYSKDSDYYRDYAISLARTNQMDKAAQILEQAVEHGLSEPDLYLVKGELSLADRKYEEAISDFLNCINSSESNYILNRAYIMCSKAYENSEVDDSMSKNIELLEKARVVLPADMTLIINERLAEAYVLYGTAMNDFLYYEKAIEIYEFITVMGWDNYHTYSNTSMLHRRLGNYDQAYEILMIMVNRYGEDYSIYKKLAYLETDIQKGKNNEQRDYQQFQEYYKKAIQLYQSEKKNNKNDTEMDYLDKVYQEMIDGGWLN